MLRAAFKAELSVLIVERGRFEPEFKKEKVRGSPNGALRKCVCVSV
jgi:hypothetical protein